MKRVNSSEDGCIVERVGTYEKTSPRPNEGVWLWTSLWTTVAVPGGDFRGQLVRNDLGQAGGRPTDHLPSFGSSTRSHTSLRSSSRRLFPSSSPPAFLWLPFFRLTRLIDLDVAQEDGTRRQKRDCPPMIQSHEIRQIQDEANHRLSIRISLCLSLYLSLSLYHFLSPSRFVSVCLCVCLCRCLCLCLCLSLFLVRLPL